MPFQLPQLPYSYDALEPHIDAETMKIHHTKHHQGYTDKLNAAIKGTTLEEMPIEHILSQVSEYPAAVRNNGGGFYNHSLFWKILSPNGGGQPKDGELQKAIKRRFQNFDQFKTELKEAAANRFGAGWAWLCVQPNTGEVFITSTPNQDNPLMDVATDKGIPILGIDVWEHAYYLKYKNARPEYIDAFFNIIDWQKVEEYYQAARENSLVM